MKRFYLSLILAALFTVNMSAGVVLSENFDNFSAGTDYQPGSEAIYDFDALTQTPGWGGSMVYPAGGSAFVAISGMLQTPALNLGANGGNYKISFRAKSSAPGYYYIMDANSGMAYGMIGTEWETYTATFTTGSDGLVIYFSAMLSEFYIDDLVVDDGGLSIPVALPSSNFNAEGFNANWQAASGAQTYLLNVYTLDYDYETTTFNRRYLLENKEVEGTTYRVTEGEFDVPYYYTVSAKAGDAVTQASNVITVKPETVAAPEALSATNVNKDSFTANWATSEIATLYYTTVLKQHTAEANETFFILDNDFSEIETAGTVDDPQRELKWTFEGDWKAEVPALANGVLGLNNQDIDFFGQANLQSPILNLSTAGGTVKVEFDVFARNGLTSGSVNLINIANTPQTADTKTFSVTETSAHQSFTLEGGSTSSVIMLTSTDPGIMYIDNLKVSIELPAGMSITLPVRTYTSTGTSVDVDNLGATDDDVIGYYVVASWAVRQQEGVVRQIPEVLSDASDLVVVDRDTSIEGVLTDSNATVTTDGSTIRIYNPQMHTILIHSLDGQCLVNNSNKVETATYTLPAGFYLVTVGNTTVKVILN